MITVVLPTASRPSMLRTALESIASQTAVDQIEQIFVSENGGCYDSEAVCKEFPSLPIKYIFRVPTSPFEHGRLLMRECLQSEMVAFLHDDDWWTPHHLATGLQQLELHPQAAVYGASHFVVAGESSMLNCSGNLFPWFGSSYAPFQPVWELSRLNVLMAELLGTISHFSTMIVRTEQMKKVTYIWDLNNPFDNDRMVIFALSQFGTLIYNPTPDAFIRNHPVQNCQSFRSDARSQHMCETTRWMVEKSGRPWEAIANAFFKRMSLCPNEAFPTLKKLSLEPWCVPELQRNTQVLAAA